MKTKKRKIIAEQLSFPLETKPVPHGPFGYVQTTDPDEEQGDYEEAMDSLSPDGYDQGMGTDSCS